MTERQEAKPKEPGGSPAGFTPLGEVAPVRRRARIALLRLVLAVFGLAAGWLRPWMFAVYAVAAVGISFLMLRRIGDRWRPYLIVGIDVVLVTFVTHEVGSVTTPVAILYLLLVLSSAISIQRGARIAGPALSILGYVTVVSAELAEWLPYAPARPSAPLPSPAVAWNAVAFVSLAILVAAWSLDRLDGIMRDERVKSEFVLLNALPTAIAKKLRDQTGVIADSFPEVTVLFADVVGFTVMSSKLAPEQVVEMLNEVFHQFDDLAEKHGLEKIKTIGDAYMVAGGLPEPRDDHAEAVVEMALDMVEALGKLKTPTGNPLSLRIGIHMGPVVAGIIGKKKFSYDLWGDTVNTASRMESHGAPGKIHVSAAVHDKLKHKFAFEDRGPVSVKGKGEMVTYFLTGRRRVA